MDAASLLHLEKIINKAIQQLLLQRIKNRHKVSQGRIVSSLTEVVRVEAVVVEDVLGEKLLPAHLTENWSENSRKPSSPGSDSEFSACAALKPSRS